MERVKWELDFYYHVLSILVESFDLLCLYADSHSFVLYPSGFWLGSVLGHFLLCTVYLHALICLN